MNKNIDLTNLLKDCPKGMPLDCAMFDDVTFIGVEKKIKPISIRSGEIYYYLTEFGTWSYDENAKCIIFPKGKTSWEGFVPPCNFKDGDILSYQNKSYKNRTIYIYKYHSKMNTSYYVALSGCLDSSFMINDGRYGALDNYNDTVRFATEEEKQKLFQAIKDNGYNWNEETKTLEKLIVPKFKVGNIIQDKDGYKVRITEVNVDDELYGYESLIAHGIGGFSFNEQDNWELTVKPKFKIDDKIRHKSHIIKENIITEIKDTHYILDDELALPFVNQDNYELISNKFNPKTLKPFDRVLVRDIGCNMCWRIQFFESIHDCNKNYPFMCLGGRLYSFCIPYNDDTKHLIEKSEEAPEFYRYWEKPL